MSAGGVHERGATINMSLYEPVPAETRGVGPHFFGLLAFATLSLTILVDTMLF